MTERKAFERMISNSLRDYFGRNVDNLLQGNIRITDDGSTIRIYRKSGSSASKIPHYDMGIVY